MAAGERPDHTATLARHTLAYGLSGLAVRLVGLVALPIYARAFSPAEFGVLELGLVTLSVALAIGSRWGRGASPCSYDAVATSSRSRSAGDCDAR